MWLSRDERHLLLGYYVNIFNIDDRNVCRYLDEPKWFEMSDWFVILEKSNWFPVLTSWLIKRAARNVKAYGDSVKAPPNENKDIKECTKEIKAHIKFDRRLQYSNSELVKRKFINIRRHEHFNGVVGISLTMEGYDLGRKYSS
jgi:hypothetical protein